MVRRQPFTLRGLRFSDIFICGYLPSWHIKVFISFRSSDGNTLVVSSTDGYCSIINFKQGELGQIYQPQVVLNPENGVPNGHSNQEKAKQDSQSTKIDEDRRASEIETKTCYNQCNATKHEHERDEEIHLRNSSEFAEFQDASTKEEPMEVIINLKISEKH